jgi:hypothetical protein
MNTFTYDLRVRGCTRQQLVSYARTLTERPAVSIQPIDVPPTGQTAGYRVVVRTGAHDVDAATIVAKLAWLLSAAGRLVSVRPRT